MMNRFTLMCDNPYTTCIRAERELNKLMGEVDKLRQVKDRLLEENTRLKAERDKAVNDLKTINYQDMVEIIEMCKFCKYGFDKQCTKCDVDTLTNGFEWRGLEESE